MRGFSPAEQGEDDLHVAQKQLGGSFGPSVYRAEHLWGGRVKAGCGYRDAKGSSEGSVRSGRGLVIKPQDFRSESLHR